jgi:predicted Fe-Mo cluster-binding NifX family protein
LGVKALITGHVGPKAFAALQAGDVSIYPIAGGSVADALQQFKMGSLKAMAAADVEGHW